MFEKYFYKDIAEIPYMIVGAVLIYILMIIYTRIFGLKSFSKMTGFDFVNTVAIGNILAMSLATSNPTWLTGIFLIGLLYLMNYLNVSIPLTIALHLNLLAKLKNIFIWVCRK